MVAGPQPIATDVLLFMDDLRRDPSRRHLLSASWEIYRAAVAAGLIADGAIDDLAVLMQELVSDDRIAFTTVSGGVIAPTPGAPWSGTWLQQLHGWRITGQGREEAARLRAEVAGGSRPETVPASPMGSATSRPAMARRLAGELEESEDLLGRAIETSQFWAPPRKCPDFRRRDYEEELAAISPATHKAVGDAYRKLNDLNWTVPARAAQEQPGAILGMGEGLRLDDRRLRASARRARGDSQCQGSPRSVRRWDRGDVGRTTRRAPREFAGALEVADRLRVRTAGSDLVPSSRRHRWRSGP